MVRPLDTLASLDPREFQLFRALIHARTGIWLRDGKQTMLASRLRRRLRHHRLATYTEYYRLVQAEGETGHELGQLINCVTTNKTSFFREPYHFEFLTSTLVPQILAGSSHNRAKTISIWSGASSTGEEPYSIAITLMESLSLARAGGWQIEVPASDIDTGVLETAMRGVYHERSLDAVPAALRERYFLKGKNHMAGSIRIKKKVASLVHFQRINLMDTVWPLQAPLDAVFFRNALIYFQRETQDLFLRRMTRLLRPRGYLFLGHSEHIPWLHDVLEPIHNTIYRLREL
jgi:chemotaxis protein methyltransferase CheR